MASVRVTLLSDGSSDAVLLPIVVWTIGQLAPALQVEPTWADLRRVPNPPRELKDRIDTALTLYPCDLLVVHRDAEAQPAQLRFEEIARAMLEVAAPPHVCIVPIRMQEAWLLFSEEAIREAAGNPNGQMRLNLPSLKTIEEEPRPKELLFDIIRAASGLNARRRKRLPVTSHAHRLSEIIDDFSPLRCLSAFRRFEDDLRAVLAQF